MAATERNEVILSEGNGLQDTKLLTDKINAVCLIETVIKDPKYGKIKRRGTGFLSKLDTPSEGSCTGIYGVVTNNHVLPLKSHAEKALVTFGYNQLGEGEKIKLKPEIKFRTKEELDYTFVGVSKADIDRLSLPIEPILMEPEPELKKGENVMIIQHPKGRQKQFSQEKISKVKKPFVFYKADTERGSSGSPVLTSEGLALVAVHHKGCKKGGYNKGSLISEILKDLQEGSYKQEEKSGSAAKKRKRDPFGEPGTSGASSTSKKRKFQESVDPSDSESSSFETDDSDSKSDGNSNTDTDSDTEEEDFGFLKKKPVKAKQKGTCAQTVNNEKGKASKPRDSKKKVKQGNPTSRELRGLGRDIGNKWRILGECLEVEEELDSIDHGYKNLTAKGFQVLKYWTQKKGSSATYRVLSGALEDELLARKDLSQKYCYG
ncbi:uncharacterized protein [Pocillopora verrucosa]|uniref:uncharacterized protein isoform X2 n=1 Tax=Pocillopora verrucosa TaxID=203993 RepID=UPI00333E3EB2